MRLTFPLLLISQLALGQCDLELLGYNVETGDLALTVHSDNCGTEVGVEELTLGVVFVPPMSPEENPFSCVYTDGQNAGWALLNLPLSMPWINIGEGPDNTLNAGDTVVFNILEPQAGTGTTECFASAIADGAFQQCVGIAIYNIDDSDGINGSSGLLGYAYEDVTPENNMLVFGEGCGDPPPVPGDPIEGCTNPVAYNYNPSAELEDGSCVYQGCMDALAINYCDFCTIEGICFFESDPECDDPVVWVPNTFTPNNDMTNDIWRPVTNADCWRLWECTIYNRWGGVIWVSLDPADRWDGSGNAGTHYVPDGVYIWQIKATAWDLTKVIDRTGTVTIFR